VCVGVTGRHHQFSSASEAIEDRGLSAKGWNWLV
jgi:hypothetical protein